MPKLHDIGALPFAADLHPDTGWPRIRFNFSNGWCASVAIRTHPAHPCDAVIASLACCPSGKWDQGLTELGETEASPEEVAAYLSAVAARPVYMPL